MSEFTAGLLLGAVIIFTISLLNPSNKANLYHAAIAECEAELPRNQKCKIVGVIDNE